VPVHLHCLKNWFRRIDQEPFWRPQRIDKQSLV
jgi:hypothetical protein